MFKHSKFPFVLVVVALLITLVAPISAQESGRWQEPIVIGWAPPDITGVFRTATDFFEAAAESANEAGFNVQVISQSPATHLAFADQVAILEDYIERQVDVIAVSPIEVDVIIPVLQRANEAGIPIIVVNLLEPIEGVDVASYIGFDNTVAAEVTAYALVDYFGGPGVLGLGEMVEIEEGQFLDLEFWQGLYEEMTEEERAEIVARGAIIEGVAGGFFSTARLNGFNNVISMFPNIEVVGEPCAADWNREKGVNCAEDILQANAELDFIWAASNEMGMGAMLAAEAAGRLEMAGEDAEVTVGDASVAIFTNDVTPESVERISEGRMIAETTHGFADWGWFGTHFAVQLACGIEVPQTFDIRPRIAYIDNARLFYPEPALPEIDWAAIQAECA
ncbi:sugar ABC transporter substrate-binding protein [Anaerolineae bacterium CFX9]|jgi:ribose transport system substrate-binding protein|nr:sugar ABC transporter substrate-binding protein [Anaerolineae bacterium CFX9]